MKMRPHVGAAPAAASQMETHLVTGQPNVVRPSIAADRRAVATTKIRAVDQEAAHAGGAHLGEGDLLTGARACAVEARLNWRGNRLWESPPRFPDGKETASAGAGGSRGRSIRCRESELSTQFRCGFASRQYPLKYALEPPQFIANRHRMFEGKGERASATREGFFGWGIRIRENPAAARAQRCALPTTRHSLTAAVATYVFRTSGA